MLVSYNWLKELIELNGISEKKISDDLSVTGIEVEGVSCLSDGLKKIVIGYVKECKAHPNSDHLNICQVEIAPGEVSQIVCGAPNVKAGQKVIVALPGARIVDNIKIKKGKMRGEVSNGMICALQELGISESVVPKAYAQGIYILPEDAPIGEDALSYLTFHDPIIELSITPNRADALSMHGVAYEVGAMYDKRPHFPEVQVHPIEETIHDQLTVKVEDDDTYAYHLKMMKHVTVKESPLWLQMRLLKAGIRPVNTVVDVTNYVLLEYGQPLHAFDGDTFVGNELLVRKAKNGEELITLDEQKHQLTNKDTVITNNGKAIALAGVMGGLDTEITEKTTTVVLEGALFSGKSIRLTGKRYNLRSESSQRFEKGINIETTKEALDRACQLIQELSGGDILSHTLTGKECVKKHPEVSVTLTKINDYLGTHLTVNEVTKLFSQLDFPTQVIEETFHVTVPFRRWDITLPVDLIEEIARIYGYDRLPSTLPTGETTVGTLTPMQRFIREIRHSLNGAGLTEAISYALTTEEKAHQFTIKESQTTRLMWPMSEERAVLRLNLISGLLDDIAFNQARKNEDLAFYEIGRVFFQEKDAKKDLPQETNHLALALTGTLLPSHWKQQGSQVDFYSVKGIFERLCARFGIQKMSFKPSETLVDFHPGRSGIIYLDEEAIGVIGQIHPTVAKKYNISETYVLELDLELLMKHQTNSCYEAVSKYPNVKRDIALLVKKEVTHEQIVGLMKEKGGHFLKEIHLFDVYEGKGIQHGYQSLAYTLVFNHSEATLTDEEITRAMTKVQEALIEQFDVEIR